jgi:hypothetical protein
VLFSSRPRLSRIPSNLFQESFFPPLPLGDISLPAVAETLPRTPPPQVLRQKFHAKDELRKIMRISMALKFKCRSKDKVLQELHCPPDCVGLVVPAAGQEASPLKTRQNRV